MRRPGSRTLGDLLSEGQARIYVNCLPCGRSGSYSVERLVEKHGRDAGLPDLLAFLSQDCPKRRNVGIHDRCRAGYLEPIKNGYPTTAP